MSEAAVRTCPMCGEQIAKDARECQYCGERLPNPAGRRQRWDQRELRQITIYQKAILACILAYFVVMVLMAVFPRELVPLLGLAILCAGLIGVVFAILLAVKVYNPVVGVLMALVALVPCVGLITLFVINQKATAILTQHGHKVGLLGASLSQFETKHDAG